MQMLAMNRGFILLSIATNLFICLFLSGCGKAPPTLLETQPGVTEAALPTSNLTASLTATPTMTILPTGTPTLLPSHTATSSPTTHPTTTPSPTATEVSLPQASEPLTNENAGMLQELHSWGEGTITRHQVIVEGHTSLIYTPYDMRLVHPDTLETIAIFKHVDRTLLSSDKQFLVVTYKGESRMEIWQLPEGDLIEKLEHSIEAPRYPPQNFSLENYLSVTTVSFSQDGSFLAAGYGNAEIVIWRTGNWEKVAVLASNISNISGNLIFSRDGKYLASIEGQRLVLWQIDNYKIYGYIPNAGNIGADPFSDNSNYLLATEGPKVLIWDVRELSLVRSFAGGARYIREVKFAPDEEYIFIDGILPNGYQVRRVKDGVRLNPEKEAQALAEWGFSEKTESLETYLDLKLRAQAGYYPPFQGASFVEDSAGILAWGIEDTQLHGLELPEEDFFLVELGARAMEQAVLSPDKSTLAVCLQDQDLALVELSTRTVKKMPGCRSPGLLAYLPDGRLLRTRGALIEVVDLSDGKVTNTLQGHTVEINSLYVHSDGVQILSGSRKLTDYAEVILWKTAPLLTRTASFRVPDLSPPRVINIDVLAISPDGKQMTNSRFQGGVEANHLTGEYPLWLSKVGFIWTMAYSPDGRLLAMGDRFGQVYLVETGHGKKLYPDSEPVTRVREADEYFLLIQRAVRAIIFLANGTGFYSVGDDGVVRLWGAD
jgi:WD40 repeat protein